MASLPTILLILAALSAGAMVIAILVAFRSQREAQSAIFPIVREEESVRAKRAKISIFMWVALTALFLGGWLATLRLTNNDENTTSEVATDQPAAVVIEPTLEATLPPNDLSPTNTVPAPAPIETETPAGGIEPLADTLAAADTAVEGATPLPPPSDTPVPEPSATPLDTTTPQPTATNTNTTTPLPPTATPSPTPVPPTASPSFTPVSPTNTPTLVPPTDTPTSVPPTLTPSPDLAKILQVPTSAPRTPAPPAAKIGPIQFAEAVNDDGSPINPTDFFLDGVPSIYAVYIFSGIPKDIPAKAIWYQNGVELERQEGAWPWGERGLGYRFIVPRGKGLYKLELYINDSILSSGLFEIR